MISTNDGEFYPEKNLDRSYKIPKRSKQSDDKNSGALIGPTLADSGAKHSDTPLADSYYNYPYDPRAASAYYQNYSYFEEYGSLPGQVAGCPIVNLGSIDVTSKPACNQFVAPSRMSNEPGFFKPGEYTPGRGIKRPAEFPELVPGPTPSMSDSVAPLQQSICDTLKGIKETPKTKPKNIFERTVPDITDESLPAELKLLFQPLYCKLCSVQLSSNQTARMHYKAKSHEKKIRKWLTEWAEKTGQPLPQRATRQKKAEDVAEKNPAWFHCDVCDLELTGQIHAESHYMGKNHQKALLGYTKPAGAGYYDKDGKWVRIKNVKSKPMDFEKGEDNFGVDFKKDLQSPITAVPPPKKEVVPISNFHCKVCNIYTTHPDILENHFKGQKHTKKLKQLGISVPAELKNSADKILNKNNGLRPASAAIDPRTNTEVNLTVYRTPSGLYYCALCNTTINSESSFLQHLSSKGHDKKALQLKAKETA